MRGKAGMIVTAALLAACHGRPAHDDAKAPDAASAVNGSGGLSITIPGMDAKVALPALDMGRHVDLDGIRLAPDTHVSAIDVASQDANGTEQSHKVVLRFASPQPPDALLAYYRQTATAAGFVATETRAAGLVAAKGQKQFALALAPAATGSTGTITFTGE